MSINKQLTILFVLLSLTSTISLAKENIDLRLIYSSDFHAEIKPCGCTAEGNLGGILRRASKFSTLKKSQPNTVLVSAGDILDKINEQNTIKANYMLEGHTHLGLDAILPGERDLAHPPSTLNKFRLPWVLTNKTKTLPFTDHIKRRLSSGRTVLIYGLLEPTLAQNNEIYLQNPEKSLKQVLSKTKANKNDFVILLVHGSKEFTKSFTKWPLIDVIVRGHLDAKVDQSSVNQKEEKHSIILSAGYRGQRIGIADFNLQPETRLLSNRVIPLTSSIPDHPELTNLYTRYNNSITKWWSEKTARMKVSKGLHSPYAPGTCKTCHSAIHKKWQQSKHSHAIDSLKQVGKQNDPECLKCHTTGMHKNGGFISITKTPERLNVKCEACHSAARNHADYPLANKLPNAFKQCASCHTTENSPGFSVAKYWSQISHALKEKTPLHKQSISAIIGEYDILKQKQEILNSDSIEILEFFNFYCSRCYVFNSEIKKSHTKISKLIKHKQIPIIFGVKQEPWASLAYIVAEEMVKEKNSNRQCLKQNLNKEQILATNKRC